MTFAIQFEATIKVLASSKISLGASAWAPNIRMDGRFFTGRIIRCEHVIPPGGEGTAMLGMLVEAADLSRIGSGTQMTLCDGPSVAIAEAVVGPDGISESAAIS